MIFKSSVSANLHVQRGAGSASLLGFGTGCHYGRSSYFSCYMTSYSLTAIHQVTSLVCGKLQQLNFEQLLEGEICVRTLIVIKVTNRKLHNIWVHQ